MHVLKNAMSHRHGYRMIELASHLEGSHQANEHVGNGWDVLFYKRVGHLFTPGLCAVACCSSAQDGKLGLSLETLLEKFCAS